MGFDIQITVTFHLCPETGKLYHYETNPQDIIEKVYGVPDIEVPEEFRKYLVGRGHIFHAYTEYFNETQHYDVGVEDFLAHYPSWEEVVAHPNYYDEWTKEDHDGFEDLLAWCTGQPILYGVSWSY